MTGVFKTGIGKPNENNTARTIDLVCRNGANDAPPFWDPPYDHDINPFPECVYLREYSLKVFSFTFQAKKRRMVSEISIMKANCCFKNDM